MQSIWFPEKSTNLIKPNFFIIGAPKCGTTTLAAWLSQHPDIFMSNPKEPHFFNTDHIRAFKASIKQYESIFKGVENERRVGEASTYYLLSDVAARNILKYNPLSKFIVCTRDPSELAYSLYLQKSLSEGIEWCKTFQDAWSLRFKRASGVGVKMSHCEPKQLAYHLVASIGTQIEKLLSTVDSDRVLIVPLSHIANHPRACYLRVLSFLEIEDDGRTEFSYKNPASKKENNLILRAVSTVAALKRLTGSYTSFGIGQRVADRFSRPIVKPDLDKVIVAEVQKELLAEHKKVEVFERTANELLQNCFFESFHDRQV